jgi:hypothetical protein
MDTLLFATALSPIFVLILVGSILLGWPLMWVLISWIISKCGWRKFAAGRECPAAPGNGITVNVMNLVFGRFASYNHASVATFTPEGFHLRPRWILKLFHPPFFVPWEMVVSCRKRSFFRRILPEFEAVDGNSVLYLRPSVANYRRVESMLPERLRGAADGD